MGNYLSQPITEKETEDGTVAARLCVCCVCMLALVDCSSRSPLASTNPSPHVHSLQGARTAGRASGPRRCRGGGCGWRTRTWQSWRWGTRSTASPSLGSLTATYVTFMTVRSVSCGQDRGQSWPSLVLTRPTPPHR